MLHAQYRMHTSLQNKIALLASAIALLGVPALRAGQPLNFTVDINTTGLSAESAGAPFYLDITMTTNNPDPTSPTNTATLSNFQYTGGSATGSATTTGSVTGNLSSGASLTASAATTYSDIFQAFSSSVTNISFNASITDTEPFLSPPQEFTVTLLDSSTGSPAPIFTSAPDQTYLLELPINSTDAIATYNGTFSADGNTALSNVSLVAIPEPSVTAAAMGGVAMAIGFLRRRSRSMLALLRLLAVGGGVGLTLATAHAQVKTVWYILMENRNFTQSENSNGDQVYGSTAAPYLNSLITPGNANSAQVSYCTAYHNVLSVYDGSGPSIHPSEPNYVWMEAGSNLSKLDDNDPYGSSQSVLQIDNFVAANPTYSGQNLCGLLQAAGITWAAYSEETNNLNSVGGNANGTNGSSTNGNLTANAAPSSIWTVPLASFSGTNSAFTNPYNGTHQYNFACKHTGSLFFADTNGTTSQTVANTQTYPGNPEALNYRPLPNLASDLTNGTCAQYNVITPDQYNDMHTALTGGYTYNGHAFTGSNAQIAQVDNFCSIVVPEIMASPQYQAGNGLIVIWTDETEGTPQNDFAHTLTEILISPLCKGNAYASTLNYTHSSDLNTMQKIFQVVGNTPTGFLNDAANPSNPTPANLVGLQNALTATGPLTGESATPPSGYGTGTAYDLSDLFQPGVIPTSIPTVSLSDGGILLNRRNNTYTQTATVTNMLSTATTNPVFVEVAHLPGGVTLTNATGTATDGNPYILAASPGLASGASATVVLQFTASAHFTDVLNVTSNGTP
jgi:hypothetical protein